MAYPARFPWHRLPLRIWLPAVVLGCFLLVITVSVLNGIQTRREMLLRESQETLRLHVARLVRLAEREQGGDVPDIEAEIAHLSTDPKLIEALLTDGKGRIIAAHSVAWRGQMVMDKEPSFDEARFRLALAQRSHDMRITADQRRLQVVASYALPAAPGELRSHQRGMVLLAMNLSAAYDEAAAQVLSARFPELAGALLIAALMVALLRHTVTRPLDSLNRAVARLAAGESGVQVTASGPPEVAALAEAFNAASKQIAESLRDLQYRESRYRALTEVLPVGIFRCAVDGHCVYVNERWCKITGVSPLQAHGLGWLEALHGDDRERVGAAWEEAVRTQSRFQAEYRFIAKDGTEAWVVGQADAERDAQGEVIGYVGSVTDITGHRQAEAEIEWLAYHDALTGLPNRRHFLDLLAGAIDSDQRMGGFGAVLQFDLDNFKHLNDARSHDLGDRLLAATARRLQASMPATAILAHFDGDSFAVLLPRLAGNAQITAQLALRSAEELRLLQSEPLQLDGENFLLTASIGISIFPKGGEDATDLLKEAETAMYRAKAAGRNTTSFFEPSMQTQAESRFTLENHLRHALEQEELRLYLQPQVDTEGRIVGAEALVRWQHPERGLLLPGSFIPVAEESGLIVPLGEWVLRQTCRQLARLALSREGAALRLAVNVSPRQFRQANFVDRVRDILRDTGADPTRLTLEVTEGLVIDDIHETISRMVELETLGVHFSIDDFGTGYSSLAYLKRLPVREIKIDRTFVQDAPTDTDDAALVEAMLSVARHLSLSVVAEGVETEAQADFLKARGCLYFQGYLYGRPESASAFITRICSSG